MENKIPNFAEMRKLMEAEAFTEMKNMDTATDETVGSATDIVNNTEDTVLEAEREVLQHSPNFKHYKYETPVEVSEDNTYSGPGIVIDKPEKEPEDGPMKYTGISKSTQEAFDKYINEMDAAIEKVQKENEELVKNAQKSDEEKPHNTTPEEEFDKSYNEAVVVIDKIGMGRIIDFTDEEREKLTKSKTIRLEEVETVSINTLNTKKLKNPKNFNNILKNINTLHTTPICLPLSGYTANIRGCTAYELMGILETGNNVLLDAQTKWSIVHSKLESTSLGNMSFNEFLFNTAAADYNNFIYGILCATYPEIDTITMKCPDPDCKGEYEYSYSVRELIRAERMSDKLKSEFGKIIDASVSKDTAELVHNEAPVKQVKSVKLPISGVIVEIQVQSAYDLINNSIKSLSSEDSKNAKYMDASIIATLIKRALVPDPEDPESMYEFTDTKEIAQIVYNLRERDVLIIKKFGDELIDGMTIEYGYMKIKCPHCGKFIPYMEIEPERLLFQRYRQELGATIE